jgi:colicin import membrane protein
MAFNIRAYTADGEKNLFFWPFVISFAGHILLFGIILFKPNWWKSEPSYFPSVINVQMVDMKEAGPAESAPKPETSMVQQPEPDTAEPEKSVQPEVAVESAAKPEVSVAPPPKAKIKTALKYKTFKPKKVLKKTIERLENKVESASPSPDLRDTIKRLKEQVEKAEKDMAAQNASGAGEPGSNTGGYAPGSRQEAEIIDIYRTEIAYHVNKNWAYAEQLSGGGKKLMASIVFKVMPDGTIQDIFFIDRSGNPYLDDSAYKAIVKSSPLQPHPPGLGRPYVELGLRFTPEGVQ